ncbi:cytochrome P450 94A1-like [Dioscorea cayenensis subsp. rotundata]|uniref:Cytochrome P450 94A1-like n=1 Tax=Dioscorea cayennensis subsp. rotundata TaxID=55577 RepID=A0AB40BP10_DIOCR|nr:cytochrome P450 94A1-like [Dioscorea cayenensis subsp. rotundata]
MDFLCPLTIILLLFIPLISIFFSIFFSISSSSTKSSTTLRPYPIIGNLPQFLLNRHHFLSWMTSLLSSSHNLTITFHRPGNVRGLITANPSNLHHYLKSHSPNFPKGPRVIHHLQDFLGRGIFNVDGPLWLSQRKTASFEFNTRSLRNFIVLIVHHELHSRLLPLLLNSSRSSSPIDLQDLLERFAFDNVCKLAFNHDPVSLSDAPESRFARAFKIAAELSAGRFRYAVPKFWVITRLFNIGSERKLKESIAVVHDFATQIIKSKKGKPNASAVAAADDDLLSRFLANEENNSDEFLRDIVISFILAGRETTSSALSWFFWLISLNTTVEDKIIQEISSIRARKADDKEVFEFEELREMHYLHASITEAMRLYPPVPVNSAMCMNDDVLPDGSVIKKGMFMAYNSYAMGRMESIWGKDCLEFKPERWLDNNGVFRPESPYKYPVFHAGPRMCLGKEMAYIQMKSIVACVLERFRVDVVEKEKIPEHTLSLTLRMKHGLMVRIRDRY